MGVKEEEGVQTRRPIHIGFIADGCRRWALSRNLPILEGYMQALQHMYRVAIDWCFLEKSIKYVTIFALSTENFAKRPPDILDAVFQSMEWLFRKMLEDTKISDNNIKIQFIGNVQVLPSSLRKLTEDLSNSTQSNSEYILTLCIVFGGRWEIVEGVRKIIEKALRGDIRLEEINERTVSENIPTSGLPDIDIVVRTAEHRISNFMLWRIPYAEVYFVKKYFQDFSKEDLHDILKDFAKTERRYGDHPRSN